MNCNVTRRKKINRIIYTIPVLIFSLVVSAVSFTYYSYAGLEQIPSKEDNYAVYIFIAAVIVFTICLCYIVKQCLTLNDTMDK